MRFSFVVSAGLGYHIPRLFETNASFMEFEDALRILSKNGFPGVELNLSITDRKRLTRIAKSIRNERMQLAAVGTGMLYLKKGLCFTDRNLTRRRKAISAIKEVIEFASSQHALVILGLIRGGTSIDVNTAKFLRTALVECDRVASEYGVRLALEAINRYETSLLNGAAGVAELIRDERLHSTGLLLDTFHMNIEETSIEATIRDYHDRIFHFHIADSNRWAPGRGHLHIENMLRLLEELGYENWVSAEVIPKPDNINAVKSTSEFLADRSFVSYA